MASEVEEQLPPEGLAEALTRCRPACRGACLQCSGTVWTKCPGFRVITGHATCWAGFSADAPKGSDRREGMDPLFSGFCPGRPSRGGGVRGRTCRSRRSGQSHVAVFSNRAEGRAQVPTARHPRAPLPKLPRGASNRGSSRCLPSRRATSAFWS